MRGQIIRARGGDVGGGEVFVSGLMTNRRGILAWNMAPRCVCVCVLITGLEWVTPERSMAHLCVCVCVRDCRLYNSVLWVVW